MNPATFIPESAAGNRKCFPIGLASSGVYIAVPVARNAVGSYPAFPSLPQKNAADYFCCTFPEVTFAGCYPALCPVMLGLSSSEKTFRRNCPIDFLLNYYSIFYKNCKEFKYLIIF